MWARVKLDTGGWSARDSRPVDVPPTARVLLFGSLVIARQVSMIDTSSSMMQALPSSVFGKSSVFGLELLNETGLRRQRDSRL